MPNQNYRDFYYLEKEDYDKSLTVNGDKLTAYSKKKLNSLYPDNNFIILGETFERKKRDKEKDIGRIELNEKRLFVASSGEHCKIFKKQAAFVELSGGGYIALLQTRLLLIILIILLLLGSICCGVFAGHREKEHSPDVGDNEISIKPIASAVLTITGTVTKDLQPIENAALSLQSGSTEIAAATTDANGNFLINDVKNGSYNLVCTYGESILTKSAFVCGESIVVDFIFPADDLHDIEEITGHHNKDDLPESKPTEEHSEVKAIVDISGELTPPIAVDGLSEEAMLHMIVAKEVDITFSAVQLSNDNIPERDRTAIEALSGELEMTYYDFSVTKAILKDGVVEKSEHIYQTKSVIAVVIPYDSSRSVATYAFRCHDGKAEKLAELAKKPDGTYEDGTYYVESDTVSIYSSCFSTYAVGAANGGQVVRGSDTITYSNQAVLDLNTGIISLLYKHDADSTNDAKIEIYLVGENGNLLIAQSDVIPVGYQIESVKMIEGVTGLPSVGTYGGLMKIIYLDADKTASTNVDIPLSVAIVK